jgi:hypothetical protein
MQEVAIGAGAELRAIKALVVDAVTSPKTKALYGQAVDEFLNGMRRHARAHCRRPR